MIWKILRGFLLVVDLYMTSATFHVRYMYLFSAQVTFIFRSAYAVRMNEYTQLLHLIDRIVKGSTNTQCGPWALCDSFSGTRLTVQHSLFSLPSIGVPPFRVYNVRIRGGKFEVGITSRYEFCLANVVGIY